MSEISPVPTAAVGSSAESGVRPSLGATEGPSGDGGAFSRMLQDVAGGRPTAPEASGEGSSAGLQPEEAPSDDQPSEESATVHAVVDHLLIEFADVDSGGQADATPVDEKAASAASPVETLLETAPAVGPQVQTAPVQNGDGARTTKEVDPDQAQAISQPATTPGNKPPNLVPAFSTSVGEASLDVHETQMASGPATGRPRTDGDVMLSPDRQPAVAATPMGTDASPSAPAGPTEPRLMGPQGDLPPAAVAAKGPPSILHGGQQVGGAPISDNQPLFSSPVGLGGDHTEWAMSVKPLGDPASGARTPQDQWSGNGEPAGSGSSFHGDPVQGTALGGQTPSGGQGPETRSAAPVSEPVRPAPQPGTVWDMSAPRTMRLELQSPDGPPLRLHVSLVEQTVYAKVVTDQPEVQDFLLRNQSRLESQLQSHGLEMGQFSVSVDRQGQEPLSYGWEKIWQQSDRRSQGIPSPMEADAAVSAGFEAGEQRRVNLFA